MRRRGCDRAWQIDAYRAGVLGALDAESFERHTPACTWCKARLEGDERLRELAGELPVSEPTELGVRRLRGRILRDVGGGPSTKEPPSWGRRLAAGAAVAAMGLGAMFFARRSPIAERQVGDAVRPVPTVAAVEEDALAGSVTAGPEAHWTQERHAGVERVDLIDGTIRVKVRPQTTGERFFVAMPDGEIEVRGTVFDVDVRQGATRRVSVTEGVVELRLTGRVTVRLGPSESWPAPAPSAVVARPPATAALPKVSPPPAPPSAQQTAKDGSDPAIAYAAAVERLRDGRYDEAASGFHAILLADPSSPQAEDASFLEAVALARAGRTDAAALAGEHHLARFPRSFHAREVAILVARAASQRGDCEKARSVVASWTAADASADIRAALGACAAAK